MQHLLRCALIGLSLAALFGANGCALRYNRMHSSITENGARVVDADRDGMLPAQGDCDDQSASVYPKAPELCDGLDNDCDTKVDEDVNTYYIDRDGDGFGRAEESVTTCRHPGSEFVERSGDCNDAEPEAYSGKPEICGDGIDNDCDGYSDDHPDADADGVDRCAVGVFGADGFSADADDTDARVTASRVPAETTNPEVELTAAAASSNVIEPGRVNPALLRLRTGYVELSSATMFLERSLSLEIAWMTPILLLVCATVWGCVRSYHRRLQ